MRLILIESRLFAEDVDRLIGDEGFRHLQATLLRDPESGAVMPGCGGLRKLRIEQPRRSKGKRGGCRVIYLHLPDAARIELIAIYGKNEKEDLSSKERRILKSIAEQIREEVRVNSMRHKDRK